MDTANAYMKAGQQVCPSDSASGSRNRLIAPELSGKIVAPVRQLFDQAHGLTWIDHFALTTGCKGADLGLLA